VILIEIWRINDSSMPLSTITSEIRLLADKDNNSPTYSQSRERKNVRQRGILVCGLHAQTAVATLYVQSTATVKHIMPHIENSQLGQPQEGNIQFIALRPPYD
jgi:hypothetical protein